MLAVICRLPPPPGCSAEGVLALDPAAAVMLPLTDSFERDFGGWRG